MTTMPFERITWKRDPIEGDYHGDYRGVHFVIVKAIPTKFGLSLRWNDPEQRRDFDGKLPWPVSLASYSCIRLNSISWCGTLKRCKETAELIAANIDQFITIGQLAIPQSEKPSSQSAAESAAHQWLRDPKTNQMISDALGPRKTADPLLRYVMAKAYAAGYKAHDDFTEGFVEGIMADRTFS